eukprot:gene10041-7172_t
MHNLDISYMHAEESHGEVPNRRRRSVSSDRAFSRDSETGERVSVLIPAGEGNSKVKFYRFSSVILIPSRTEYRSAECDLWWQREDFVGFQQSASSELRMLCNIDNIGVREARRRLYQPEYAVDAERRRLHDLGGDYSSNSMSRSSSSLFSLDEEEREEEETSAALLASPSQSNIALRVFQSAGHLAALYPVEYDDGEDSFGELMGKLALGSDAEGRSTPNGSPIAQRHGNLHLCVPLKPFTIPLVLEPAHASHHSLRPSRRAQNREDNGFLAVMGFCSFALPIVGYFLFNNSKVSLFQAFS